MLIRLLSVCRLRFSGLGSFSFIHAAIFVITLLFLHVAPSSAQLLLNEGSNKNYSTLPDETGEFEDWIEIYNSGNQAEDLHNYSLSDNGNPGEWVFPHQIIQPGSYLTVFCDGKNRFYTSPFTTVLVDSTFQPQAGWNTHQLTNPFYWDGLSNIILNICTYNSFYTNNSLHFQSATNYNSTIVAVMDGASSCAFTTGGNAQQRPNIRFNQVVCDTGVLMNGYTDYPSAYSNWYWSSRQQYLFRASELLNAGLSAGYIDSISFSVVAPCPTGFEFLELSMATTGREELDNVFAVPGGSNNHTNFRISSGGETIGLYNPSNILISSLNVDCEPGYDVSIGLSPDASSIVKKFTVPSPGASNNNAAPFDQYAIAPVISVNSGVYQAPFSLTLFDGNVPNGQIYYTLDGHDPDTSSSLWTGTPIMINQTTVIRARAYLPGSIPSPISSASYLFNVSHTTPIISLVTDPDNLFGPNGMFDNPTLDLLKTASIDYFDSTVSHQLLFNRRAGIIMDGGWGSRGQPQRPFRIKFDDGVLGQGPVQGNFIPDRQNRNLYSDFYMWNGGGNYMVLPFKDAAQTRMLGKATNNYYAGSRPATVYINGSYWGLYDMREKFNTEMFKIYDNASESSIEILGSSAQYNFQLRAIEGDVQHFYDSYNAFSLLDPVDTSFWSQADQYFDMKYYNDYLIAELWMNNADWCFNYNNLKIYRSNASQYRWRYCLMDLEYGLLPNLTSDFNCTFDLLGGLINHQTADPWNPHFNIFWKGMQNHRFRNYFINRFADLMNTEYQPARMVSTWNTIYNLTLPEMPGHFYRWGDSTNVAGHMLAYDQYANTFINELQCRPEYARNYIQSNLNLPAQIEVNLYVSPPNSGKININTITPDAYPWSGIYFDGVPITLHARDVPGYTFSHWKSNGLISDTLNPVFIDTISAPASLFIAHFKATTGISERNGLAIQIFPNPAQDQIWIHTNTGLPGIVGIGLTDMQGKSYEPQISGISPNQFLLQVSDLCAGYYLLNLTLDDGSSIHRSFVKTE